MKKIFACSLVLLMTAIFWGCKKNNYPGGVVSSYMSIFDVRNIHKGGDVTLTADNMFGATQIAGVVVSDHSGGNIPTDLLILQDSRRLGQLRGIAVALPNSEATSYVPGDSVIIKVEGAVLKRVNGILQITGLSNADITKVASGIAVQPLIVKSNSVINTPGNYESTLISITKAGFDPSLPPGSTYAGDKVINDGFGNLILHTEATASFANNTLPFLSNFTGIVLPDANGAPQLWARVNSDITILSATAPKIAALVITGYLVDPPSTDANYEYIQLLATRDIDFATNNFSIITTNNAGTAAPTGYPVAGWATGGARTYKFNITSGSVQKGQYIYVGANTNIWGAGSTDISTSKWFGKMYATVDGDDFGTKTTNLLANSGNAAGIAVFDKIAIDDQTVPVDVIFFGGNGNMYTAGPPERGYRITNTDYYDIDNPTTLQPQPFFAMGSNTGKFAFPPATNFSQLGGTYNIVTGRWTSARTLNSLLLTTTSTVAAIEGMTMIEE